MGYLILLEMWQIALEKQRDKSMFFRVFNATSFRHRCKPVFMRLTEA